MEQQMRDLLYKLDQETSLARASKSNQPDKLGINSAQGQRGLFGYDAFTVNLVRPLLDVHGLQLIKLNFPQVNPSCDYECCFWYYRLRTQQNYDGSVRFSELPNIRNLYCVRLLPSYYKPEFIAEPANYGRNRAFADYADLATELAKSCTADLAWENDPAHAMPFIPSDISLTYDAASNLFRMTGNNTTTDPGAPTWNGYSVYDADFCVDYEGTLYLSMNGDNGNRQPNISPEWWSLYSRGDAPYNKYLIASPDDANVATLASKQYVVNWDPLAIYSATEQVLYAGLTYQSLTTNQGRKPPPLWSATTRYVLNDLVYSGTNTWRALRANLGVTPAVGPDWAVHTKQDWTALPGAAAPTKKGVAGISQQWDFELLSIPPQPCDRGARNLAMRLGFTWQSPELVDPLRNPQSYAPGTQLPSVINRLRPVPIYSVGLIDGVTRLLGDYPAFTATTITADTYANIVRSSVLSVYCNVLGNSSNNSLLAIAPIDCPNLGISFTGDSIDQPLTKICSDIYTLTFWMQDEAGQPYTLPNSAIVTMELKLSYSS